jgi:hypothetical protein
MTIHYECFVCVKYNEEQKGKFPTHETLVYIFYKCIEQFNTWLFIHILSSVLIKSISRSSVSFVRLHPCVR